MEKTFYVTDPNDNELYTYLWVPERDEYKGVIQLVHGAGEHMGRYRDFALFLNSLGFIVIGNDHLSHGRTSLDLSKVHFADTNGYHLLYEGVLTTKQYINEYYPKLPVILIGHSMGSFIARYTLIMSPNIYDQAIIIGTAKGTTFQNFMARLVGKTIRKLKGKTHISPFFTKIANDRAIQSMMKNGIINKRIEWLTSDEKIQEEFENDEYCGMPFTIQAQIDLLEMLKITNNQSNISSVASDMPILLIAGELDALGGYGDDIKHLYNMFHENGYKNCSYQIVNGARHEILNELDKEDTYKVLGDFILTNLHKK